MARVNLSSLPPHLQARVLGSQATPTARSTPDAAEATPTPPKGRKNAPIASDKIDKDERDARRLAQYEYGPPTEPITHHVTNQASGGQRLVVNRLTEAETKHLLKQVRRLMLLRQQ